MRALLVVPSMSLLFACSGAPPDEVGTVGVSHESMNRAESLGVVFDDCTETASLAGAPLEHVRALVPGQFTLASGGQGLAIIVVRIAKCGDVVVDGSDVGAGTVAQIGANLVSPDGTGDINNYTLYFSTTSSRLADHLKTFGVPAQHVQNVRFETEFAPNGHGDVESKVGKPMGAPYEVNGTIDKPLGADVAFTANWWAGDHDTTVRMQTVVPHIAFGAAHLTLETNPNAALGRIFGTGAVTFPYFDSYNEFPSGAEMTISDTIAVIASRGN